MDQHSIKNVKSPVDRLDAINKAYADRIKYKTDIGNILNTVMTDHILFTFPAAKAFTSGKMTICAMWVERLADEWIQHQVQCLQLNGLAFTSFQDVCTL